jgi:hypothetical protein
VGERLSATARPRATRSEAFLSGALGLSALSVPAPITGTRKCRCQII